MPVNLHVVEYLDFVFDVRVAPNSDLVPDRSSFHTVQEWRLFEKDDV